MLGRQQQKQQQPGLQQIHINLHESQQQQVEVPLPEVLQQVHEAIQKVLQEAILHRVDRAALLPEVIALHQGAVDLLLRPHAVQEVAVPQVNPVQAVVEVVQKGSHQILLEVIKKKMS